MDDPIAGDEPDNHGDPDGKGAMVLTRGYQVLMVKRSDREEWQRYLSATSGDR